MFNKLLSKVVSKDRINYLNFIKYDKEEQCYVASNGHVLMVEHTDDKFDTDKLFNPKTRLEEHTDMIFPKWKEIIPEDGEDISEREFTVFVRKEKPMKNEVKKVVKIKNLFFNFEYVYYILKFVGNDFSLIKNGHLLKFKSKDNKKVALIMNYTMQEEDLKEFTKWSKK